MVIFIFKRALCFYPSRCRLNMIVFALLSLIEFHNSLIIVWCEIFSWLNWLTTFFSTASSLWIILLLLFDCRFWELSKSRRSFFILSLNLKSKRSIRYFFGRNSLRRSEKLKFFLWYRIWCSFLRSLICIEIYFFQG